MGKADIYLSKALKLSKNTETLISANMYKSMCATYQGQYKLAHYHTQQAANLLPLIQVPKNKQLLQTRVYNDIGMNYFFDKKFDSVWQI